MRQVTIYTTDKEYQHFLELARNLHYVKRIEVDEESINENLENIKAGLEEVIQFKKGKLKTTKAKDFLNEL
ncbi:MAG: hypothetical protein ACOVO9_12820 [Bacteroidia bacterium]